LSGSYLSSVEQKKDNMVGFLENWKRGRGLEIKEKAKGNEVEGEREVECACDFLDML
jgi:hypothetical protein